MPIMAFNVLRSVLVAVLRVPIAHRWTVQSRTILRRPKEKRYRDKHADNLGRWKRIWESSLALSDSECKTDFIVLRLHESLVQAGVEPDFREHVTCGIDQMKVN